MNDELKQQIITLTDNYNSSLKTIEALKSTNKKLKSENNQLELKISNLNHLLKKSELDKSEIQRQVKQLNQFHKIQTNKILNEKYNKVGIEKRLHEIETINVAYEKAFYLFGEKFGFNANLFLDTTEIFKDDKMLERIISSIKNGHEEKVEGLDMKN
ncbi:hypothetical protein CDIK_1183 [Cucumispora dikerogammari]|nr:hypothetical protein CDIK_1183 [Cucumispora dikerogammari]